MVNVESFEASKRRIEAIIDAQANLNKLFPNLQIDIAGNDELSEAYTLLDEALNNVVIKEAKYLSSFVYYLTQLISQVLKMQIGHEDRVCF